MPSIRTASFSPLSRDQRAADKSEVSSTDDQDQTASVSSLKAATNGVNITVEGVGVYSSNAYPDGFRWTQTITTNANKGGPLLPLPVNYVDPRPNDDTKPFYWTDAEEAAHPGTFIDTPSRRPRAGGTVYWDAILSLNGVNGKEVTRFDSLAYGFSVDSSGTVTTRGPLSSPGGVADHTAQLRSEFPDWTFK
ncbi:MAG TPA: hypothetical protein VGF39_11420 [Stellaceae bacterium]